MVRTLAFVMGILISLTLSACDGDDEPTARIVLVPDEAFDYVDRDRGLDEAVDVLEERLVAFDLADAEVRREGEQIIIELPESTPEETIDAISRRGLLQFCEPVTDEAGNVAVIEGGTVQYSRQSCRPVRDAPDIIVEGGTVEFVPWARSDSSASANNPPADQIVWEPASGELGDAQVELTSVYFSGTSVVENPDTLDITNSWLLMFELDDDGSALTSQVTERLAIPTFPSPSSLTASPFLVKTGR
ncbi:MAG: hypothetical protein WEE64_09795 [Dehalococcoidia bacterium]